MQSYGIVVEGDYDGGVFVEIIKKICPEADDTRVLQAGGSAQVMKKFPGLLRGLEHVTRQGGPVEKALVIRDADCKDPAEIEAKMQKSAEGRRFSFPAGVSFHVVKQEMETWLLADADAINRVAESRCKRPIARVLDRLEELQDAKGKLMATLSQSGLNYTAAVCREIAKEIDLAKLRTRCPSFQAFEQKVLDP